MTHRVFSLLKRLSLVLVSCMFLFSGCWGNYELNTLFIVTGVALDLEEDAPEEENKDLINITLQIAKANSQAGSNVGDSSGDSAVFLLNARASTVTEAFSLFNRASSRRMFLQHNQVLAIGMALAEQGISDRIDLFIRDMQARLEVPVVIVDGKGEEVLSSEMSQDKISGIFLAHVMQRLGEISLLYRVRVIDFASQLIEPSVSAVIPIVQVATSDDDTELRVTGMAIFKGDKMIGRLGDRESIGYIWAMGNVKNSALSLNSSDGKAAFIITKLNTKKKITISEDLNVTVNLSTDADLSLNEISGFSQYTPAQLIEALETLAQNEIRTRILNTFDIARDLGADIYEYGLDIKRRQPKKWKQMKDHWDAIFPNIELDVQVKVKIPHIGKIHESLEMEETWNAGN